MELVTPSKVANGIREKLYNKFTTKSTITLDLDTSEASLLPH